MVMAIIFASVAHAPELEAGGSLSISDLAIPAVIALLVGLMPFGKGVMGLNYADSQLLAGIGILQDRMNKKTLRAPVYGALDAYVRNREASIPNIDQLRVAENRAVDVKYLKRTAQAITNARDCAPTANYGDSGNIDITWKTYAATVKTSDKMFRNNEFTGQQQFANDLWNVMLDLYSEIELDCVAHLEANKSGVNAGTLGTFDAANDIMKIAAADKDNYLNYITTEMFANDYRDNLIDVHSVNFIAQYAEQRAQGPSNDRNDEFQFDGYTHYASKQITNGSDDFGTSYIMTDNSTAIVDWIPGTNRNGRTKGDRTWTTMGDIFGYPWEWAVFRVDSCADTTATGGATQDDITTWEVSLDLSKVVAPIDVATETPIFKYALLK